MINKVSLSCFSYCWGFEIVSIQINSDNGSNNTIYCILYTIYHTLYILNILYCKLGAFAFISSYYPVPYNILEEIKTQTLNQL